MAVEGPRSPAMRSLVLGFGLAATIVQACAETPAQPTHTARSDCAGAARPKLPDGKSVLTCEKDWTPVCR